MHILRMVTYDKAFQIFDEMIAKNYIPTATTINTIMAASQIKTTTPSN